MGQLSWTDQSYAVTASCASDHCRSVEGRIALRDLDGAGQVAIDHANGRSAGQDTRVLQAFSQRIPLESQLRV